MSGSGAERKILKGMGVAGLALALAASLHPIPAFARSIQRFVPVVTGKDALNQRLKTATELGDLAEMTRLLDQGADPDFKDNRTFKFPLLLTAIVSGKPKAVKLLLQRGADPNARDGRGTPILVGAASMSAPEAKFRQVMIAIHALLWYGKPDVNAVDKAYIGDDRSALHAAVAGGSGQLVRLLLSFGANPNQTNRFRETPLYFAAERGWLEIARLLLKCGAKLDTKTKFTGMTPLMAAAEGGRSDLVNLLLSKNADLRGHDVFGNDPLKLARQGYQRVQAGSRPAWKKRGYQETIQLIERAAAERSVARS